MIGSHCCQGRFALWIAPSASSKECIAKQTDCCRSSSKWTAALSDTDWCTSGVQMWLRRLAIISLVVREKLSAFEFFNLSFTQTKSAAWNWNRIGMCAPPPPAFYASDSMPGQLYAQVGKLSAVWVEWCGERMFYFTCYNHRSPMTEPGQFC